MTNNMKLSIVSPIYNEEENIERLYTKIVEAVEPMNVPFEIILVDDGSRDNSASLLRELGERDNRIKVIIFRKNFGQTAAMSAGIDNSVGEIVITMDADLQNDPTDIPMLVAKMEEGYDIVSGWRKNRQDKAISRKLPSKIANKLISNITGVKLNDYGCSLKAYSGDVIREVKLYGELHRFIPIVAQFIGVNITEVPVKHHAREFGKSKYGIDRTFRVILDLILVKYLLTYLTRPMHFFGKFAWNSLFLSFVFGVATIVMKVAFGTDITGNPFFIICLILGLFSLQFIVAGINAEVQTRIYYETQDKKTYSIREIINGETDRNDKEVYKR